MRLSLPQSKAPPTSRGSVDNRSDEQALWADRWANYIQFDTTLILDTQFGEDSEAITRSALAVQENLAGLDVVSVGPILPVRWATSTNSFTTVLPNREDDMPSLKFCCSGKSDGLDHGARNPFLPRADFRRRVSIRQCQKGRTRTSIGSWPVSCAIAGSTNVAAKQTKVCPWEWMQSVDKLNCWHEHMLKSRTHAHRPARRSWVVGIDVGSAPRADSSDSSGCYGTSKMARLMSVHSRRSASASRMAFWAAECDHEPAKLHQRGLVHKDTKPSNIPVNRATGTVKLTGFRNASRLTRERQSPEPPETIADPLSGGSQEPAIRRTRRMPSRASEFASHAPWSATVAMQAPVNFDLFADANSVSGVPGRRQANVSTRVHPPHVSGRTMWLVMSTDGN
jgi:hypothetical protein